MRHIRWYNYTTRVAAWTIVAVITMYYLLLLGHAGLLRRILSYTGVPLWLFMMALATPGLFAKSTFAVRAWSAHDAQIKEERRWYVARAVAVLSLYVLFATVALVALYRGFRNTPNFLAGPYWAEHHWTWSALLAGAIVLSLALQLPIFHRHHRWSALQDLKAVPAVSPVFCFGGGFIGLERFSELGLPAEEARIYAALLIAAGVLFLLSLLWYGILKGTFSDHERSGAVRQGNDPPLPENTAANVGLGLIGSGLFLLLLVAIDLSGTLVALGPRSEAGL